MHDNVKKSLDEMTSEADILLEKSNKAKSEEVEKSEKKADVKKADETKAKDVKVDHEANGDDVDTKKEEKEEVQKSKVKKSGKHCDEAKKSISDELKENDSLQKSMSGDNSAFLNLFAQFQAQAMDKMNDKIEKSMEANDVFSESMAKSMTNLLKSNAKMFDIIKSQNDRVKNLEDVVDKISHQPVARKSVLNPIEKSFVGEDKENKEGKLTKSQIGAKLSEAVLHKSNVVTPQDVASFESSGYVRPEVKSYLENELSK